MSWVPDILGKQASTPQQNCIWVMHIQLYVHGQKKIEREREIANQIL